MFDNSQFGDNGSDQNSNTYHYSFVSQDAQPNSDPVSSQSKPSKKRRVPGRAIALVLCCALAGGGAGFGGAALHNGMSGGTANSQSTTLYRNTTNPTPVKINQVDGLTPMDLSEIYAAYADSCVCITVQSTVWQGYYQYQANGAGSGFIISENGYIVTNYHVIDGAVSIKVTLNNGESYDAKLVGGEELNDVAVLKIDGISGLKPVVLGDSDNLVVGETVSTIGNALGTLSFSQTSGRVSATGRSITMSDGTVMNMIQTDTTINSGNSGGPLFDSYGRVVGITSAKYSNNGDTSSASIEGIGFAVPINDVIGIITDYMEFGYVTGRPAMGIEVQSITDSDVQRFGWPHGAMVTSVEENSCAEQAGLKVGDIITKIDDTDITDVAQMISVKNSYKAGDTVTLTVFRSGETITMTITFDEQVNNTQSSSGSQDTQTDPASEQTNNGSYGNGDNYEDYYGDYFNPWSDFFE